MNFFEVCKIIGSANTKTWAQAHTFEPKEKKKREQFGRLFAVLSLKSFEKTEDIVEITAYGKEAITRFHELYYSADANLSPHKRLEQAFLTLQKEYAERVDFFGAAGVVLEINGKMALYAARLSEAQAFLWRKGEKAELFGREMGRQLPESISGWLEPEDVFVLGTDKVFELVPQGSLQASLQLPSLDKASQILAPIVHGHQHNALAALVLVRFKEQETEEITAGNFENTEDEGYEPKIQAKKRLLPDFALKIRTAIGKINLFKRIGRRRGITVRQPADKKSKTKKTAISVAILFFVLLALSIYFSFTKKGKTSSDKQEAQIIETVKYQLDQAKSLENLNPARAKSLLLETRETLDKYIADNPEKKNEELNKFSQEIEEWIVKVSKEYAVSEASVYFDLSLVKEDFKAKSWGLTDEEAVILGKESLITFNLDKKQTAVIAGGDDVSDARLAASVSPWGILASDRELKVVDKSKQRVIDKMDLEDVKAVDLTGYAGNSYILDSQNSQVWRYAGLSDGLAKKKEYIKSEPDLKDAVSLSIDGSIWILFKDGQIVKYTSGKQDAFAVSGLDKQFGETASLFTDENQENLYILDIKNTRVVVLGKTGEYKSQYVWPGIAGALDILASEKLGKIFLLTDSRIYSLETRD